MKNAELNIALGEYDTGWHDPSRSLDRADALARAAREQGSDLLILPEMCTTGFTMEPEQHAETITGASVVRLTEIAREHGIHLIAGVATKDDEGGTSRFYNSAFVVGPDGHVQAEYRKQRLFAFAGEATIYTPGDRYLLHTIRGVRTAIFICFELRFPELFRAVAPECELIVVIANWPSTRFSHWQTLLRARAIESQAYVAGVNRVGHAGGLDYVGGSVIHDPAGETIASSQAGSVALGRVAASEVTAARAAFPFVIEKGDRHV